MDPKPPVFPPWKPRGDARWLEEILGETVESSPWLLSVAAGHAQRLGPEGPLAESARTWSRALCSRNRAWLHALAQAALDRLFDGLREMEPEGESVEDDWREVCQLRDDLGSVAVVLNVDGFGHPIDADLAGLDGLGNRIREGLPRFPWLDRPRYRRARQYGFAGWWAR